MRALLASVALAALLVPTLGGTTAQEDWPTAQGDFERTGFRGDIHGPGTGRVLWEYTSNSINIHATPAVANGLVYIGADQNTFQAFRAETGEVAWTYQHDDDITASPIVANGTVFVKDRSNVLLALEAATGALVWQRALEQRITTTPTFYNGTLYIGADEGHVYSVDAGTGVVDWGVLVAPGPAGSVGRPMAGSPVVVNETLVIRTAYNQVFGVDLEDGQVVWDRRFDSDPSGLTHRGRGEIVFTAWDGTMTVLHGRNGTVAAQATGRPGGSAALSYANITLVQGNASAILAFDSKSLDLKWTYEPARYPSRYLAASNTTVYSADNRGIIRAIALDTGELLWHRDIATLIEGSPVVADGRLFVATMQWQVVALDAGVLGLAPDPLNEAVPDRSMPTNRAQSPGLGIAWIIAAAVGTSAYPRQRSARSLSSGTGQDNNKE